jgi:hypothetical protein
MQLRTYLQATRGPHCLFGWFMSIILKLLRWKVKVKVKQSHCGPCRPWGFQEGEAPRFQDSRHMEVRRLSALRTGLLYPQEISLVFVFCVGPAVTHRIYCSLPRLIVLTPLFSFPPPSSPEAHHIRRCERPLLARVGTMGEKCPIEFSLQLRLPFPHAEDFFLPKNRMASAGSEPANLGTRGQHANH